MTREIGLRKIVVQGTVFYWKATWGYADWHRIVQVRIWGSDKSCRPLMADLASRSAATSDVPYATETDRAYVLPHQVRALIEQRWALTWRGAAHRLAL